MFDALYLSPHFDDAVLSCGAQIWDRTQRDEQVAVVTICAAPPPETDLSPFAKLLHLRWAWAGKVDRAAEDRAALEQLQATPIHLPYYDCIYRRSPGGDWLYASEEAIFGPVSPEEEGVVQQLVHSFSALDLKPEAAIWIPRAIGNHVDHQLVHWAGERWCQGLGRTYHVYADYPYAESVPGGESVPISAAAQQAKIAAILAYKSQLTSFWPDEATLRAKVSAWQERDWQERSNP